MQSVPPFFGHKHRQLLAFSGQPFRMADIFVAGFAHGDQVTLSFTVRIGEVHVQRQIRPMLHMVQMMDHACPAVFPVGFAELALMAIQAENISAERPPFRRDIERMDITRCDQGHKPFKKSLRHRQTKRARTRYRSLRHMAQALRLRLRRDINDDLFIAAFAPDRQVSRLRSGQRKQQCLLATLRANTPLSVC